jgi:iron complex transport system substrate-binding protein
VIDFQISSKIRRRRNFLRLTAGLLAVASMVALFPVGAEAVPRRVVSINLCADQLAVLLLEPGRIAALSSLARDATLSYVADAAQDFPLVRENAEEVLAQKPDLVLAGSIGAKPTIEILRRFGVEVHELGLASDFDQIRAQVLDLGQRLGVEGRAQAVVARMDGILHSARDPDDRAATKPSKVRSAAFLLPNGYSAGADTLSDAILQAAGYSNHATTLGLRGYGVLPLELVIDNPPSVLVIDAETEAPSQASRLLEHPALANWLPATRRMALPARLTICAGPQTAEAVALIAARR